MSAWRPAGWRAGVIADQREVAFRCWRVVVRSYAEAAGYPMVPCECGGAYPAGSTHCSECGREVRG